MRISAHLFAFFFHFWFLRVYCVFVFVLMKAILSWLMNLHDHCADRLVTAQKIEIRPIFLGEIAPCLSV